MLSNSKTGMSRRNRNKKQSIYLNENGDEISSQEYSNLKNQQNKSNSMQEEDPQEESRTLTQQEIENLKKGEEQSKKSQKIKNKSKKQKTGRQRRSKVYKYFLDKEDNKGSKICSFCDGEVKFKSTSNLWSHLRQCEKVSEDQLNDIESSSKDQEESEEEEKAQNENNEQKDVDKQLNQYITQNQQTFKQSTLNRYGMTKQQFEERIFKFKIIMLIIKDVRPLSIVENQGFIDLVNFFNKNYQIPSRRVLREDILKLYDQCDNKLKEKMYNYVSKSTIQPITVQFDHWSSVIQQKFISITASYINKENKLQFMNLINVPSQGETGIQIAQDLKNTLEKFKIIKPNGDYSEMMNQIQIVGDGTNSNKSAVDNIEYALPEIICFIHTCNNALKEINSVEYIKNIIDKIRFVAKYFRKNYDRQDRLKEIYNTITDKESTEQHQTFKLDVETRFNTLWYLIDSYIRNHKAVEKYIELNKDFEELDDVKKNRLSDIEMEILQNVSKNILKPFQIIFKDLQNRENPTLYKILVNYIYIKEDILSQNNTDNKQIQQLKNTILSAFQTKFDKQYKYTFNLLCLSTFLHPQYRFFVQQKFQEQFKKIKQILQEQMLKMLQQQQEESMTIQNEDIDETPTPNKKVKSDLDSTDPLEKYSDDFLISVQIKDDKKDKIKLLKNKVNQEIKQYIDFQFNKENYTNNNTGLDFFKKNQNTFPLLSQIAIKMYAIPASSTEAERIFSDMGNLITKKRNRLEPDIVDAIMFIKLNLRFGELQEDQLLDTFLRLKIKAQQQKTTNNIN